MNTKAFILTTLVCTLLFTFSTLSIAQDELTLDERNIDVPFNPHLFISHYLHRLLELPFLIRHHKTLTVRYGSLNPYLINRRLEIIPLKNIKRGHAIEGNHPAEKKTKHRIKKIRKALEKGKIPLDYLRPEQYNKLLPSKDNFEVVSAGDGTFITLNGVGRTTALTEALGPEYRVEVITYDVNEEGLALLRQIYAKKNKPTCDMSPHD